MRVWSSAASPRKPIRSAGAGWLPRRTRIRVLSDRSVGNRLRFRVERPLAHFPPFVQQRQRIVFELAPGIALPAGDNATFCIVDDKGAIVVKGHVNRCMNLD